MGVFFDDSGDEEEDGIEGGYENPVYAGPATHCAACEQEFVPGVLIYVINGMRNEVAVCYFEHDDPNAEALGKENCLERWCECSGNDTGAVPMLSGLDEVRERLTLSGVGRFVFVKLS